jgi:uncharacterized membrane protein
VPRHAAKDVLCEVCGKTVPASEAMPARYVRGSVADAIRKDHPDWSADGYVCLADLNEYRMKRVRQLVEEQLGAVTSVEMEVVKSIEGQDLISRNTNEDFDEKLTFGQRVADRVASFGGSWPFIFLFAGVLGVWITANSIALLHKPFDPYPYILLNLCLSCLAAIQAPVIMMSQNRQETRDRLHAEHDYQVNLKTELEVRALNARVEELLRHQWQGLLEIQQVQTEMMEELSRRGQPEGAAPTES